MNAIELSAPRTILIEDRGKTFTFNLARISAAQWLKYFAGILSLSETQGSGRVDTFDSSAARIELVDTVLAGASGYEVPGGGSITAIEGWQHKIPVRHRLTVGNTLLSAERSDANDDDPIMLGRETVYLDAIWSAGEDGKMRKLHGLRHTFETPTAEHQRRYSRDISRSRVIGGSRGGKTQWLGAQATLAKLYDELIVEVEGYTFHSEPLDGRESIVENMDTYHKVAAVEGLFEAVSPKVEEKGE